MQAAIERVLRNFAFKPVSVARDFQPDMHSDVQSVEARDQAVSLAERLLGNYQAELAHRASRH